MSTPRYFSESQIEINATPATVWAVLSDFHGLEKWARRVRVTKLGDKERGIGAGRRAVVPGLGTVDEVVIQWEPEQRLSYSVTPVSVFGAGIAHWRLEAAGPRTTRVFERFEYDMRFGIFGALLHALVVKRKLAQAQPNMLKQFKKGVESSSAA